MNITNLDFGIYNTSFHAGIRRNRSVNRKKCGRTMHGMLYIFTGFIKIICENGKRILDVKAGDLVYIPKYEKYELKYMESTHFALINFDVLTRQGEELKLSDGIELLIRQNTNTEVINLFKNVEYYCSEENGVSILNQKVLLYQLFSYLGDSLYHYDVRIINGVRMLEQRYMDKFAITELAEACYMGESTFRKLFTDQFGISPIQYRNQLRMKKAKTLLDEGTYTIAEIAELSGFCSESYFCRLYKKMYGGSPKRAISQQHI